MDDAAKRLWDFTEACQRIDDINQLGAYFLDEMAAIGFPYVALASHIDPLNPPPGAVVMLKYPTEWVAHFSDQGYHRYDPIFETANRWSRPFLWSEGGFLARLDDNQKKVLVEATEVGLANGLTIPIRGEDALPASCSLVPDRDGVSPEALSLAHKMAVFVHERARRLVAKDVMARAPRLTHKERRCLTLSALGKSDWVISTMLGVSEKAINRTIERAKTRLGVATRTQAIMLALHTGEISLYDVT